MQFTYAMFDMDGTLVDSMGYWDEVCGEYLRQVGLYSEEIFDKLKPMTLPQTADYLESEFGITLSQEEIITQMCRIMLGHYKNDVQAKPGIHAFLDALQKQGVRMCVVSSSPEDLVKTCLEKHGLLQYFDFLISAEEVGKGKTEPDIYYEAAKRLGASPETTMVFEDAMIAGLTAKRAGFRIAAIFDDNSVAEWDDFRMQTDYAFRTWDEALQTLAE